MILQSLTLCICFGLVTASRSDYPCDKPNSWPWCNTASSYEKRVEELIYAFTPDEILGQFVHNASGVPRLGIPPYMWWSEGLHGVANSAGVRWNGAVKNATSFPSVATTAATFDASLWYAIGRHIAIEGRSMYNVEQAGLTYWTPNINLYRDPRWGRGAETPGEDPFVSSVYARQFVSGFQAKPDEVPDVAVVVHPPHPGAESYRLTLSPFETPVVAAGSFVEYGATPFYSLDPSVTLPRRGVDVAQNASESAFTSQSPLASACCKHFLDYSLENATVGNRTFTRHNFNSIVSRQDHADSYLPAFESCVKLGKASGVMCSYNAENGIPSCANGEYVTGYLREHLGFDGYVTSDCGAVYDVYGPDAHHYVETPVAAIKAVMKAGTDVDCGPVMTERGLRSALAAGAIDKNDLWQALQRLYGVRFRLGQFDGDADPWRKLGPADVGTSAATQMARDAARAGAVHLMRGARVDPLHNRNGLPRKVLLTGPNADAHYQLGPYSGKPTELWTPLLGLQQYVAPENITYQVGCSIAGSPRDAANIEAAAAVAQQDEYDLTFIVLGLDSTVEGEAHDRPVITLPGMQVDLVKSVSSSAKEHGGVVIVFIYSGGSVDTSPLAELCAENFVDHVVWMGYPGQAGGLAMADFVFATPPVVPGGRLPVSWYKAPYVDEVDFTSMSMRPYAGHPGRTHRFYNGRNLLFPFGHAVPQDSVQVLTLESRRDELAVIVSNNGPSRFVLTVTSASYPQPYIVLITTSPPPPRQQDDPQQMLVAFYRMGSIPAGGAASYVVRFSELCHAISVQWADVDGRPKVPTGTWQMKVDDAIASVNLNCQM